MRRILLASLAVVFASLLTFAADSGPLLLQSPTLSKTPIAFAFGGDIWIVSRAGGDAQRLVTGTGVLSHTIFSPDGKSIAYLSDESGEYALHIRDQSGMGTVKKIDLGTPPSFFYTPKWSPDSKKITYSDKRLNLWYVDVEFDPKLVREGHDPQLERAVEVVLELLKKNPIPTYPAPPYPNYHDTLPVPVR